MRGKGDLASSDTRLFSSVCRNADICACLRMPAYDADNLSDGIDFRLAVKLLTHYLRTDLKALHRFYGVGNIIDSDQGGNKNAGNRYIDRHLRGGSARVVCLDTHERG